MILVPPSRLFYIEHVNMSMLWRNLATDDRVSNMNVIHAQENQQRSTMELEQFLASLAKTT